MRHKRIIEQTHHYNYSFLNLSSSDLDKLPPEVLKLKNIKCLYLSGNRISNLPNELIELSSLEKLNLSGNRFSVLPNVIGSLQSLLELNFNYNRFSIFPKELTKLKKLGRLSLSGNSLMSLPSSIGELINLEFLYLSNNDLVELPIEIGKLINLNRLDLSHNNLKVLPSEILNCKNLKEIILAGNPIESPPIEVAYKGIEAIKNYFRQIKSEGQDYIYEAKLIIVGEAGAGKTSLSKKIENHDFQLKKDEESTKGIDVIQWRFRLENEHVFKVNIWDFGGQEIYHATHQFFLTKRSLYALVADIRKEDTDFFYWLNIVELLSDNSPLLIIKNEKQDRHREINERQLRGQFTNLKEILATNLATNRGLPEILLTIKHFISNLPHIGTALPKTWVAVREILENDNRNYINIDEYYDICDENNFNNIKDKLQLSGYLHDIGVCLHFQDDPILKKTVILKPEWATDAVYKVLDNEKVIRNFGKFNKNDLESIWSNKIYLNMQDELLQLMIKFNLCYQIPSCKNTYIAPDLLNENQPEYKWNDTSNLILKYTYEFMPKGIITRFIVIMHKYILDQKFVWKSGVLLLKDETKAEVIEYYGKRKIQIRIYGKHKKEFMTILAYEFDKIHCSYNRLKFNRLIPCNCPLCKDTQSPNFYKFDDLNRFIEKRVFYIPCVKSGENVNVLQLIDDVIVTKEERSQNNDRNEEVIPKINFSESNKPTFSNENKYNSSSNNGSTSKSWEKIVAFSFGVLFILIMLGIAIYFPKPTEFQIYVFRVVLSLAASGIGAVVPGFLHVEWNQKYLPLIRAGGAIALFVVIYFVNPPNILSNIK